MKKGILFFIFVCILFLLNSNDVYSDFDPLNVITISDKTEVNKGESFKIEVFFPGMSHLVDVEAFKIMFYSDPSLVFEKRAYFDNWDDIAVTNTYIASFSVGNPYQLKGVSDPGSAIEMTNADMGMPVEEEGLYRPPFLLIARARESPFFENKIIPGDHEIKVAVVYKIGEQWYYSEDSIMIHINDFYEEHEKKIISIMVILAFVALPIIQNTKKLARKIRIFFRGKGV